MRGRLCAAGPRRTPGASALSAGGCRGRCAADRKRTGRTRAGWPAPGRCRRRCIFRRQRGRRRFAAGAGRRGGCLRDVYLGLHRASQGRRGAAPGDRPAGTEQRLRGVRRGRSRGVRLESCLRRQYAGRMGAAAQWRAHRDHRSADAAGARALCPGAASRQNQRPVDDRRPVPSVRTGADRGVPAVALSVRGRRRAGSRDDREGASRRRTAASAQRLRPHGNDHVCDDARHRCRHRRPEHSDRPADREHADLRAGCAWTAGAGGGNGGDLYRRRGCRTRLSEAPGADSGAFRREPVPRRRPRADVQDGGPGPLVARRQPGVPRPGRCAGQAAWLPDRAGRDRGEAVAVRGRAGGGGDGA